MTRKDSEAKNDKRTHLHAKQSATDTVATCLAGLVVDTVFLIKSGSFALWV
jgi:hypothetical protein